MRHELHHQMRDGVQWSRFCVWKSVMNCIIYYEFVTTCTSRTICVEHKHVYYHDHNKICCIYIYVYIYKYMYVSPDLSGAAGGAQLLSATVGAYIAI